MTDDVGEGFARGAPSHERVELCVEGGRRRLVRVGEETLGGPPQDVFGEQASVEVGFVARDAGRSQPLPGSEYAIVDSSHAAGVRVGRVGRVGSGPA